MLIRNMKEKRDDGINDDLKREMGQSYNHKCFQKPEARLVV